MGGQMQVNQSNSNPLILAVFAHPDDESFLAGGTLAYYAAQGLEVKLLCLTHGELGIRLRHLSSSDSNYQKSGCAS